MTPSPRKTRVQQIILASASPRREEILKKTGLPFRVVASNYHEEVDSAMSPRSLARLLSLKKAEAVAERYQKALVIGADTFIVFKGRIIGKPHTKAEARRMLTMLNGKTHTVITGFTIIDGESGKKVSRSAETTVVLKKLTRAEIDGYVRTGEPLDKAGAYAVQGIGAAIVSRIEGDYFNVMGLPFSKLVESLKEFGVKIL
jgi:septum formation protein